MKKTKFISQNNKMNSPHTKKYSLASRLIQRLNQSLQESICFSRPRINSIFFSPALRYFNFFSIAHPSSDKQSENLLQTLTGQWNLIQTTEARTANKVLPKAGVTGFYDTFVLDQTLVFQIKSSAETPRLRQYPNRCQQS